MKRPHLLDKPIILLHCLLCCEFYQCKIVSLNGWVMQPISALQSTSSVNSSVSWVVISDSDSFVSVSLSLNFLSAFWIESPSWTFLSNKILNMFISRCQCQNSRFSFYLFTTWCFLWVQPCEYG